MAGKKYLLLADLPAQRDRVEAVAFAFMRAAYLTDSILFILADLNSETASFNNFIWRNNPSASVKIQMLLKNQFTPEQIITQVDYFIVGGTFDDLFYIDAAIRHDVEIIGTGIEPEDIFSGVEVSAEVQQFKENLQALIERDLLGRFPPEQYEYFLLHEGIGDSMTIFFWLKEYRKPRDKKILVLCYHPLREEMMRACPYVDAVLRIHQRVFDYLTIYCADRYGMRKVFTASASPDNVAMVKNLPPAHRTHVIPDIVFRNFLEIPPSVEFKKYPVKLPEAAVARANEIFSQLNLTRGKAVFFVINGVYFGWMPHHNEFWLKLAQRLNAEGYEAVFNGQNELFSGCKNVFLSLFETSAFVGLCGHIVSVPTGFVEAVATFNTVDPITLQFIFPNMRDVYYKQRSLLTHAGFLKEMQYSGSHFVDKHAEDYESFLRKFVDANVERAVYQWGDTAAEDDALIEKIVGRIISAD